MKRVISDLNGVKTTMHLDGDQFHIQKTQNLGNLTDITGALRNERGKEIKSDTANHLCHVPLIIIVELRNKYGLDLFNPDETKGCIQVLQRDYPDLFVSELRV